MTPKAKATKILTKFIDTIGNDPIGKSYAKDCAEICCSEMIANAGFASPSMRDEYRKYWGSVKMELLKLK